MFSRTSQPRAGSKGSKRTPGAQKSAPSADVVYRSVKEQIVDGTLAPGGWLVEAELADQFQVSRTPVREALKRLVAERLAAHDPFRGTIVRSVDPREAAEIGEMREVHDGLAARLAASRITESLLKEMVDVQAQLVLAVNSNRISDAASYNARFHQLLYEAAGNKRLAEVSGGLQDFVRRYTIGAISDAGRAAAVIVEHDRILQALQNRSPAEAEEAARSHGRACMLWSPAWSVRDGIN